MNKALSIRQPWAWLIAKGIKDGENRTWKTNYRGLIYIHAGTKFDDEGYEIACEILKTHHPNIEIPAKNEFYKGGIVGMADIIDCVEYLNSPWFFGPHYFIFKNQNEIAPYKCKGRLGLFNIRPPESPHIKRSQPGEGHNIGGN